MAVRTGGPGPGGLSIIMFVCSSQHANSAELQCRCPIKNTKGVTVRRLKVSGSRTAGTSLITLEDVKVPVENLVGTEGQGMRYIMTNFNHERLTIAIGVARTARVALAAAVEYVMSREAFGKTLMEQPVVRQRIARAGTNLEALWSWVENFAYLMTKLSKDDADRELGGLTAAAKAQGAAVMEECSSTAVLLFGGNGLTQSGRGELVEKIYRDINVARIPGGSSDVLYASRLRICLFSKV